MESKKNVEIELLDEDQTAVILGNISPRSLQSWRVRGYGPKFIRIGHSIRYLKRDLIDWIEGQRSTSTSK